MQKIFNYAIFVLPFCIFLLKISEDVIDKAAVTEGPLIVETIEPVAFVTHEPSIIDLAKNISSIDGGSGKKGVVGKRLICYLILIG